MSIIFCIFAADFDHVLVSGVLSEIRRKVIKNFSKPNRENVKLFYFC